MVTVPEFELEQKISEFCHFLKDYAVRKEGNFKVASKRDNAVLTCINGEVSLEFNVRDL